MAIPLKYQAKEVLNKVLNAGEDALNVDLSDSVTVTVDSEFPAASAISDNFANPTTTSAMSMLMGYDGSAWDRVTIGGGTEAAALRVTIANDSTGVVSVDDGGGALTVDGTVTANLSATDNAVLDAIDAVLDTIKVDTEEIEGAVETIEGAVSGSEMQVDVVAALPSGTNTVGKVEAVGDVAEDAAVSGNPVLTGGRYDATARTLDDGDAGALALDPSGALYTREYTGQYGAVYTTASSDVIVPPTGKAFVAVQMLEDTTFDSSGGLIPVSENVWFGTEHAAGDLGSGSETTAEGSGGKQISNSVTFPQGMTIFGRWSGIDVNSGSVIAYIGDY